MAKSDISTTEDRQKKLKIQHSPVLFVYLRESVIFNHLYTARLNLRFFEGL